MKPVKKIEKLLLDALKKLGIEPVSASLLVEECSAERFGDYTSNVAMQLFPMVEKGRWNSPHALAEEIVNTLDTTLSPTVAGPGFINFTLTDTDLSHNIREILDGENIVKLNQGKKAIVEYSSPNIAKPFTIGHLRTTIIGAAVANLLENTGYIVYRDNHLGDWGTQFGKLIVAIKELGEEKESLNVERITTAAEPVKELVKLYVEFHEKAEIDPTLEDRAREWFTKLENGDQEARRLWQLCIDWSWTEFDRIYTELGVFFSENNGRGYGESYFEDKMSQVVDILEKSGYMKTGEEGAKLFFFPDEEFSPLMILKKDGSTLYATRDLATDFFRINQPKYGKDILIINEVGAEQTLYFRQIYRIEELLGWVKPGQRIHVKHGLYRLKEGKMSTRKGNVIWLGDAITEAKERAIALQVASKRPANLQTAKQVAIGALKWNDLKRSSQLDVTFDWDEILSMDGNSGPYMQYTVVRAKSVLGKALEIKPEASTEATFSAVERTLARELLYFENTLYRAATEYAPHLLCTYLYTLAGTFNSFYNTHRILDENEHIAKRLALTQAVVSTLELGMAIIGIEIPESM
ncbi:MAG: arginine--tRNA ligase [Candidatus Woesebacteria bacterium]